MITRNQIETLRLAARSPRDDDGWSKVSSAIFSAIIEPMPPELFEVRRDDSGIMVRLTEESKTILKWS
jgi:hypothetical protein